MKESIIDNMESIALDGIETSIDAIIKNGIVEIYEKNGFWELFVKIATKEEKLMIEDK